MVTKDMENARSNNQKMLCGGCGSKVGNVILESSLRKLSDASAKNIVSKIGDDAAVIKINSSFQALTTDHLRSFTKDAWLKVKLRRFMLWEIFGQWDPIPNRTHKYYYSRVLKRDTKANNRRNYRWGK